MFKKRLEERVALITGAAQGIGKETAIILAREGATVIVSDINDSLGASVAKKIGGHCMYLHLDVANEDDWKQVISIITDRFGKLNILVNNAGVTGFQEGFGPQDPENASLDSWRKVNAVNSDGRYPHAKDGNSRRCGECRTIFSLR